MKILIIRFSSIGDIVLTTPVIRALKKQLNAEVHFLTKIQFAPVVASNPYLDKNYSLHGNLNGLIRELRQENYDLIVDLHKNIRSYRLRLALKVKTLSYRKLSVEKFLLTKFGIDFMPKRHITLRCLDALKPLGVVDDGAGLDYFIPPNDEVTLDQLPVPHRGGFIAIVIGASYYTKKLPLEKLKELCAAINDNVVLIGGKEDFTEGEAVAAIQPEKIYNACGKFNLNASADLIRKSRMVISHDTGMQYIASAVGKKILAIWGGTSPKLDVEPYYGSQSNLNRHKNFVVPGLSCQPCSNFGTKTCPKKHFNCMRLQDINAIADAVR